MVRVRWIGRWILRNMVWSSVHVVMGLDIFKIENVNAVQNVGALGSSRAKRKKI